MDPSDVLDFAKAGGYVTAIAVDDQSGEVLMVASFRKTLETGRVHYWSKSRDRLWLKGEESGNVQRLRAIYVDCDGDVVLLRVDQAGGAACHTGKRSCFFRRLEDGAWLDVGVQVFDPDQVYRR
jgi:phosphoribosyl-AMP cyclohydrolase